MGLRLAGPFAQNNIQYLKIIVVRTTSSSESGQYVVFFSP